MGVRINVSGGSDLKAALKRVGEQAASEMEAALTDETDALVSEARADVRVDTGSLRDSITAEVDGLDATVAPREHLLDGSPVYALVNEFGRSSDPGQPYMTPAAERSRQRWPKRAGDAVKRAAR